MKKRNITKIISVFFVILLVAFSCVMPLSKNNSANNNGSTKEIAKAPITGVAVDYTITNDWGSGFTAEVVLNNNSGGSINGWQVSWTFPNNQSIVNTWNCELISTNPVKLGNVDYNKVIPDGGSASFGFQGNYSGSNGIPTDFTVEGGGTSSSSSVSSSSSSISSSSSSSSSSSNSGIIKIEAENWDDMYGVKTEDCNEGTLNVGWIDVADWLDYNINISKTSAYTMTLRVANLESTGKIDILVDGIKQKTVNIPNTGGWQNWESITTTINLTQGSRTIRLYASGSPWNLNWFELKEDESSSSSSSSSSSTTSSSSSSSSSQGPNIKIEAEDYNDMYGVKQGDSGEGTPSVGWIDVGDWMDYYEVYIPKSATYTVTYRVACLYDTGKIDFLVDGNYQTTANVPNTGGWSDWQNITATVNLTQGNHTIRLYASGSPWNLNWFELSEGGSSSSSSSSSSISSSSSSSSSSQGHGVVGAYGELKVSGAYIHGSKTNAPVQVKGLSLFWNQWGGENFYNSGTVNDMVDNWNVEILRAAISTSSGGKYVSRDDASRVVDACIEKGIYVIIDFHSHHAEDELTEAEDFFWDMAVKYGQYDNVIFEVYNEPLGREDSWNSTIKPYAEKVIKKIRDAGSDNLILVGSPFYASMPDAIVGNTISDSNTAYTFHFYAYSHTPPGGIVHSGTYNGYNDSDGGWAYSNIEPALGVIPLFCTEWGTCHSNGGRDGKEHTHDSHNSNIWWGIMDQYKISSCMWAIMDDPQASAIYHGGSLSDSGNYIKGKLYDWKNIAPWR